MTKGDDFSYTTYKAKTIPMPFTILDNIKEKYDALQKILNVDEPKKLVFGNTPDRYCGQYQQEILNLRKQGVWEKEP